MTTQELVERLEEIAIKRDLTASVHSNPNLRDKELDAAKTLRAAASRLSEMERTIEGLREALKPFALYAAEQLDHYIPPAIAECDATPIWGGSFGDRTEVTVGDFKRARTAADKIRVAMGGGK